MFAEHKISIKSAAAVISPCGKYRYALTRYWGLGKRVLYVMLNPSTADGTIDDPTIRRCRNLAKQFKNGPYGSLEVVNLFAYRTAYPKELRDFADKGGDPVGPENDLHIQVAAKRADLIILAYGAKPYAKERADEVCPFLDSKWPRLGNRIHALALTKHGYPWHPLMVEAGVQPRVIQ
jgi:hypothetical protein